MAKAKARARSPNRAQATAAVLGRTTSRPWGCGPSDGGLRPLVRGTRGSTGASDARLSVGGLPRGSGPAVEGSFVDVGLGFARRATLVEEGDRVGPVGVGGRGGPGRGGASGPGSILMPRSSGRKASGSASGSSSALLRRGDDQLGVAPRAADDLAVLAPGRADSFWHWKQRNLNNSAMRSVSPGGSTGGDLRVRPRLRDGDPVRRAPRCLGSLNRPHG